MKKETSSLSSFIEKLDAEILKEDEAVLLIGGFSPVTVDPNGPTKPNKDCTVNPNTGCINFNCGC